MKKESENKTKVEMVDIIQQLRNIMNTLNIKQSTLAEYADVTSSQFSKIMNYKVALSLHQLSNIATKLNMREIDIYTYPYKYVNPESNQRQDIGVKATLSIELSPDKKDQVLKLVFGENNLEIFNK